MFRGTPSDTLTIKHRTADCEVYFLEVKNFTHCICEKSFWITDANVYRYWKHVIPEGSPVFILEPGEAVKSLETFERCVEWLLQSGAMRRHHLVAFGGGTICDLVGFVASTYMRGVSYSMVPTTLLAQVDAAIGGKVGINHRLGKNLIGSFYPPNKIFIVQDFLKSLSSREFLSGTAEVWKHAFVKDASFFYTLTKDPLYLESALLGASIYKSVQIKAGFVMEDEFDCDEKRAVLNFGHTIGHALELVMGYGTLLHGEAIAIGMCLETKLAVQLGITCREVLNQVEQSLKLQGLMTSLPKNVLGKEVISAMERDKKRSGDDFSFSFLEKIGVCRLYHNISSRDIQAFFA